jgi:pimeloyl-ACP methyl ester carboxylesterase
MARFTATERGNTAAKQTMLFVHGWPDTDAVFARQYAAFAATHRLVTLSLPGYIAGGDTLPFMGLTEKATLELLRAAIADAMQGRAGEPKPIVVAHDWGAHYVFWLDKVYPGTFAKIVGLDVGGHASTQLSGKAMCIILAYHWTNINMWFMPRVLGTAVTRGVARLLGKPDGTGEVHSGMNYPYVSVWRTIFAGALPVGWQDPSAPVLFLYGSDRFCDIFSERWVQYLEATPGCGIAEIPGNHWFFTYEKSGARVNDLIRDFLQ